MRRLGAVLTVLLLLAAACGSGDDTAEHFDAPDDRRSDFDLNMDDEADEDLSNEEVIEVIQEFWDDHDDELGFDYEPIPDERITAVPSEDRDLPDCFGEELPEDAVEDNAGAFPCPEGLSVFWDPELIDDEIQGQFGETGPAVVFAHEFGHIAQFETGIVDPSGLGADDPPSVIVENQADCLAGAWVAEQVEEGYGPFADPGALDESIGALLSVRDEAGTDPGDLLAHGSGFDRVRGFQDGWGRGVEYCATYIDDPPFIDELPFRSDEEAANMGNLPFDEAADLFADDLDDYFDDNVDDFDSPGDPFDDVDEDELQDLHDEIGDAAVGTVFGLIWAQRAQEAAGDDTDGEGPLLQRACLVGSWLGDILQDQRDGDVERPSQLSLSPGDLDETIITFLRLTEQEMGEGGLAFEALIDMRQGVFGGIDDCRLGE